MYCIKCGKRTQSETILCDVCQKRSGFRVKTKEDVEKNRRYGRYLVLIGHIFVLIGLLSSFILIKNDAPKDYVAEIFEEKTMAVVEPEEETEDTDSEEEKEEEEVLEEIGYSYSILSYLTRRNVTEEKDKSVLKSVAGYVKSNDMAPIDLSDEDTRKNLENYAGMGGSGVIETLEYYDGVNVQGAFIVIIAIVSILVAVWLAIKNDFGWSMLFSLIATCPVWVLIVRLDGINAWEYQSGLYFLIGGIFAALIGGMIGGNVDVCADCGTVLPGGAGYCFQCAKKLEDKNAKPGGENKSGSDDGKKPEHDEEKQEELPDENMET